MPKQNKREYNRKQNDDKFKRIRDPATKRKRDKKGWDNDISPQKY